MVTQFGRRTRQSQLIRGYLITPFFLLSKEQLKSNAELTDSYLFKYEKELRNVINLHEFKVLITLIGCFFGYRKFYDTFYEHPKLPIFKSDPDPINWETSEQTSTENEEIHTESNTAPFLDIGLLAAEMEVNTPVNPTIEVKKSKSNKPNSFSKKLAKKTDQEYLEWLDNRLSEGTYTNVMRLSEFATHCQRNQKLAKELLVTDPRFSTYKEGKIEMITRSIINMNGEK